MKSNGTKARIKDTKKPLRRPYRITFGRAERTDVFKHPSPVPVKPTAKSGLERRRGRPSADATANGEKQPDAIQPNSRQCRADLTEEAKEMLTFAPEQGYPTY